MRITNALLDRLSSPTDFAGMHRLHSLPSLDRTITFQVTNPSTGELLAELPDLGPQDAQRAIERAHVAQDIWKALTARQRSDFLHSWYTLIVRHKGDLAAIVTSECGKPLSEAKSEVIHAAAYIRWYAEEASRVYGETIPSPSSDRRTIVLRQPIGVVGAITPWNFPASMVARKIAPALAAGCTVILKPAEQTPLTAGALIALAEQAGFPPGVINLLYASKGDLIGQDFCTDLRVRKISFTGSTEVGRLLMRQCADQVKCLSLELGGNAPFIVFDDADLSEAIKGAVQAKFRNAGQTCVAANRIYVHSKIYDEFVRGFVDACRDVRVGDGFDVESDIGPLINEMACCKVEAQLSDAIIRGARVHCGGSRLVAGKTFFQPTVLTDLKPGMRILGEETFGPLAPILEFQDVRDVINRANDTIHGLAAYFYTSDQRKVWNVSEALEYGMVGINTGRMSSEAAPFGGVKQSGMGREGSRHGIDEYLELKYLCVGGL
ncbi:NAD-dependent succinate-semialdehyde dehydrogenase [Rhizobium leguminosarum]|uniref:NAD-dependent succinate-semialdehyde dehydrogenase n=1 Tax=Rhizobium leguminosarum TaxID=384 RepID=UPI003F9C5222